MSGVRLVSAPMRAIFLVGWFFVLVAGVQLFVLSDDTDYWFAWTIEPPLTAQFLGAFYFSACAGALLSAREQFWDRARVGVPGLLVFVWLTLIATLIHLDKFHLDDGRLIPTAAAWIWLAVYVIEPPVFAVIYVRQLRAPGGDSPPRGPIPGWFRWISAALGALLVIVGVVLFVAPSAADEIWPWALTPLTARASAAWLVGQGLVLWALAQGGDWIRARLALPSLLVLTVLQGIALARDSDAFDWEGWPSVVYVIVLSLLFAAAAYGWFASRRVAAQGG